MSNIGLFEFKLTHYPRLLQLAFEGTADYTGNA